MAVNLYERYCVFQLLRTEYLELLIVALEFFGQGPLNLLCFREHMLGAGEIVLQGDSLVAPTVLASRARGSRLLAYMYEKFLKLAITIKLLSRLSVSHEFGVGNPIDDMLSHGRIAKALEVMRNLPLDPVSVAVPEAATAYIDDILASWCSLTWEEQNTPWMHEPRGGGRAEKGGDLGSHGIAEGAGARHS